MAGPPNFFEEISYSNDACYVETVISSNLAEMAVAGKTILDFGCGSGDATARFCRAGTLRVDSVDISRASLASTKEKISDWPNVTLIQADLNVYLPLQGSYDLIWSDTVVELLGTDLSTIVHRLSGALRPNGIIYMSAPERTWTNRILYFALGILGHLPRAATLACLEMAISPRYRVACRPINTENLRHKLQYLFVPSMRLVSAKDIVRAKAADLKFNISADESNPISTGPTTWNGKCENPVVKAVPCEQDASYDAPRAVP